MTSVQLAVPVAGLDYPNALVDSVMVKAGVVAREESALTAVEPLGKCINPATGEPVSARRADEAVFPVAGSVKDSEDGNGTGTCPECSAHVRLSTKGFVTSHNVRKESIPVPPPRVWLVERQTAVTDTGVRVGSPDGAERARGAELSGHSFRGWHPPMVLPQGGTVTLVMRQPKLDADGQPVLGKKGKPLTERVTVTVPGTEANVRTALRQEQSKRQRKDKKTGDMVGGPDAALLARYGRMLRGLTGTEAVGVLGAEPGTFRVREAAVMDAPHAPQGRGEGRDEGRVNPLGHVPTSPGPAFVQGRAMSGEVPQDRDRVTAKGMPRNAIGWGGPLGRPRVDRVAVEGNAEACQGPGCAVKDCPAIVGGRYGFTACHVFRALSQTDRRHYWAAVAVNKRRDERAREMARRERPTLGRGYVTGKAPSRAGIQRV